MAETDRADEVFCNGFLIVGFIGAGLFLPPIIANGMARYLRLFCEILFGFLALPLWGRFYQCRRVRICQEMLPDPRFLLLSNFSVIIRHHLRSGSVHLELSAHLLQLRRLFL